MSTTAERLFDLLPAVYKVRDSDQKAVLEAFLEVLDREGARIEEDIERLYENWFIETCDPWVVPYIGDLLSVRTLVPIQGSSFSPRAMVANTIAYRRGKGTAATLEQLAKGVSGWPARAVEMFQLLGTTQFLNHLRLSNRTIDLRDWNALELVNSAFDGAGHTIDVRHIDNRRGKHNIMDIGLFLWRLAAYPLQDATPDEVSPGMYRFAQLGADAPLFTPPRTETAISDIAAERNVSGPLRRGALYTDLESYRRANLALVPLSRPKAGDYYGSGASVLVTVDGEPIPPMDVVAADLSEWSRPPAAVSGLASGSLSPFPPLSSAAPSMEVTIGEMAPRTATLSGVPSTLEQARRMLQDALRSAGTVPAFTAALVAMVGSRLVVLPGVTGEPVSFGESSSDATTVHELGLDASSASKVRGVLSRDLSDLRSLSSDPAVLEATIAGHGTHLVPLATAPTSIADARSALETALHGAAPSQAFADATVSVVDDRLLVMPGIDGLAVSFRAVSVDPSTVYELGLWDAVAVDPRLGRFAFALDAEPQGSVTVSYAYGFGADLGGGPYDRSSSVAALGAPSWNKKVSQTDPAAFPTIGAAIQAWANPADGAGADALVTIVDNGTYVESLSIPRPVASNGTLAIVAEKDCRPVLQLTPAGGKAGDLVITGTGTPGATIVLNGLVVVGGVRVEPGSVEQLHISHCTLVPGRKLTGDGRPAWPGSPSLVAGAGNEHLEIVIDRSITGPLSVHETVKRLTVRDSIVDSPTADHVPVTMSGNLSPFPSLSSATPTLDVTIGETGPVAVTLGGVPTSLGAARQKLQAAIRNAHWSAGFTTAHVTSAGNRLVVVSGTREPVDVAPSGTDPTAAELRFDDPAERSPLATLSGPLKPFAPLSSPSPALGVVAGNKTRRIELTVSPISFGQARAQLQKAIRSASVTPAFAHARVAGLGNRLLVIPGQDRTTLDFQSVPDDRTTVEQLKLLGSRPAIGFSDDGGEPGPRTSLERVTVFGSVRVRELSLASESIFVDPVIAIRRQLGCVRYSYLAPGSLAPRRFRCQPSGSPLRPLFTSTSYGEPAFAQLARSCPTEISAGAEGEGEMGAFNLLQQNQRVKNLQASLSEYLRFGLEAGIFLAT
jgi:hypothetical protein